MMPEDASSREPGSPRSTLLDGVESTDDHERKTHQHRHDEAGNARLDQADAAFRTVMQGTHTRVHESAILWFNGK